ncbi:MAG: hypothetical protein H0U90_10120 [Actinobacteria bacterium]|nr:hypothetical protein [Actinomycetota bacterium]
MNLAYIDPGSGSLILQMILGGLAAAAVFMKLFWHRLMVFLRIRKPYEAERASESAESETPAVERRSFERAGEPAGKP